MLKLKKNTDRIICAELPVFILCIWRHSQNGGGGVVFSRHNGFVSRNETRVYGHESFKNEIFVAFPRQ